MDYHTQNYIEFGSGENDKDLLGIIYPNIYMDGAAVNNNHFLFYKDVEGDVDYLYATPRMIINALITGSSDLPYKLIREGKLKGCQWTNDISKLPVAEFSHYKMAKCLLGCAERDLKQMMKSDDPTKKLKWADTYTNWVVDMLYYREVEYADECIWGDSHTNIDYIRYLRGRVKELPKTVSGWCVEELLDIATKNQYPDAWGLGFTQKLFFDNWRESL